MKDRIKKIWGRRRYRYTIYLSIVAALIFLASSIIAVTFFGVLPESASYLLPEVPQPQTNDRVLIITPHPDDETIAAGGYINKARVNGAQVKIDLVTDGNKHGLRDRRYQEFKDATKTLGVEEKDLNFWGFTDGQKSEKNLVAIKSMIMADIREFQPTVIFAPMTQDAHYDHFLTGKAYLQAVDETGYAGQSYGYLVHHRYFPQPKKYAPRRLLMPPIRYLTYGQGWTKINLEEDIEDDKNVAVLGYKSQLRTPLLNTLLKSMVRQNEIFIKLD